MSRKEKQQTKDRASSRQLMGITDITAHSLVTGYGELVFFMVKPTNISVLSDASVGARIYALMNVLKGIGDIEILCLNSRENFEDNKSFLRGRMDAEQNPAIRKLLQQDTTALDRMQVTMATAREFVIIIRLRKEKESEVQPYLSRIEKSLKDQGFTTKKAGEADIKRLLGVYYEQYIYFKEKKTNSTLGRFAKRKATDRTTNQVALIGCFCVSLTTPLRVRQNNTDTDSHKHQSHELLRVHYSG